MRGPASPSASGFACRFAVTSRRDRLRSLPIVENEPGLPGRSSRQGVALNEGSGFAFGYAVTGSVLSRSSRTKPGAGGGIRTLMELPPGDFESPASAIPPLRRPGIVFPPAVQGQARGFAVGHRRHDQLGCGPANRLTPQVSSNILPLGHVVTYPTGRDRDRIR